MLYDCKFVLITGRLLGTPGPKLPAQHSADLDSSTAKVLMACILSTLHCAEPATAAHSLGQRCSKWKEEKGKTTLAFTLERIRFLLLEKQPNQFPGNGQQDTALSGWAGVGFASLSAAGITSMPVSSLTSMRQEALDSAFCCTLSTYFQRTQGRALPCPHAWGWTKAKVPSPGD